MTRRKQAKPRACVSKRKLKGFLSSSSFSEFRYIRQFPWESKKFFVHIAMLPTASREREEKHKAEPRRWEWEEYTHASKPKRLLSSSVGNDPHDRHLTLSGIKVKWSCWVLAGANLLLLRPPKHFLPDRISHHVCDVFLLLTDIIALFGSGAWEMMMPCALCVVVCIKIIS